MVCCSLFQNGFEQFSQLRKQAEAWIAGMGQDGAGELEMSHGILIYKYQKGVFISILIG